MEESFSNEKRIAGILIGIKAVKELELEIINEDVHVTIGG